MTARTAALAAAFVLSTAALAVEPAQLRSIDPLTLPAPTMLEPMTFAPDPRTPAEKIQPMLWAEALKQGADAVIPIIITLHEPLLPEHLRGATAEADAYRVQWVASLAHQFEAQARAAGMTDIRSLSHFPILFGKVRGADLAVISDLPHVRSVETTPLFYPTRAQGGALINAPSLRTIFGGTGAGIGVAVIDSGVDDSHPEFGSRVVAQGDFTLTTGDGTVDGYGHGTQVAGIIAGASGGMAPQANIWALKVFDNSGNPGPGDVVFTALDSAYSNRNNFGGLRVINMSLGQHSEFNSDCDASFVAQSTIVNQLVSAGIAIFAASGNDEHVGGISAPACLANVISVGAVSDASGITDVGCTFTGPTVTYPFADLILCYSNSGIPLDILAPSACAITTRSSLQGGGYSTCFNGTSAASPYAAGVAAQILSLLPLTTPAQLRTALMTTGRPITDVNSITRNRIDAVQAYQALAGSGGGCVPDSNTACLLGGKFKVEVQWTTVSGTGPAQVMYFGGQRAESDESVFFWFFGPTNFEMGVKMVDACGSSFNHYWAFVSGLTNQAYTVTITRASNPSDFTTFSNPLNTLPTTAADIYAFTCP